MTGITLNHLKALVTVVFWGASFVATKVAIREIHPITLIVLRFGLGIIVLLLAVWQLKVFQKINKRDYILLMILGVIGITIHQSLQANGLLFTTASNMAWLVALTPIFTALLAWLFLKESFTNIKLAGFLIAFIGAVVMVTKGLFSAEILRLPATTGDLLALTSSLNWAIFSVASKPLFKRLHPTLMMTYVMFFGWLLILPFFVKDRLWQEEIFSLSIDGIIAVLFLGIFCSGIAYIFWYDALSKIEASQTAAFIYLEPLVTTLVASILLKEVWTLSTLFGGLMIFLGVYLVNLPTKAIYRKNK